MEVSPQAVFLTGASSGIGAAIVRLLTAQGHHVFATARRLDRLEQLKEECSQRGAAGRVIPHALDVLDVEAHSEAVKQCVAELGGIDVAIPNAGLGVFSPLDQAELSDWLYMVDVNVKGALITLHTCLPHLMESKGLVINIGSVASRNVFPNSGVYCATKHAVLALGESIRQDLKSQVASTTICPGAVDTDFIEQTRDAALLDQYRPGFKSGMHPDFVARQVLHAMESRGHGIISDITIRPDFL
jgi:NADP-dependent 3-hydroxy acid dehydrogenase YdfG